MLASLGAAGLGISHLGSRRPVVPDTPPAPTLGAVTRPWPSGPEADLGAGPGRGHARRRAQDADFYAGQGPRRVSRGSSAPTITDARDGLGPLYNARACLRCHIEGGRGKTAAVDEPLFASLVRLSRPGKGAHGEPVPDPVYGAQLQPRSTSLRSLFRDQLSDESEEHGVPPEGDAFIRWSEVPFAYPDGSEVMLRSPTLELRNLRYGPLAADTIMGVRHTPSLAGIGLLELIDEADIVRGADPHDADSDGVSGRVNRVWDPERKAERVGRFGLKANQPSVRLQVAGALNGDMGISSPAYPSQPCTDQQPRCVAAPHGDDANGHEISEDLLQTMVFFNMSIAVPERRRPDHPSVVRGEELFAEAGCADCHTPHYVTTADADYPHLSEQNIWPYTDLLLHDMGPKLADGREDFLATGSEWRTPPLWGAGLARAMHDDVGFLHDGRARTIEEAIVWHAGEARSSRERFAGLSAEDRRSLVAFVRSL